LDLRQSPIDIEKAAEKKEPSLEPLDLDSHDTTIHLINKGHTIEQEYEEGSTLTFEGVVYELLQFHFHTLSEHTRNGERGLMELHAVFKNDDTGNLAVIGQIYELGQPNQFLAVFDQTLPSHEGDEVILPTEINLEDGFENTKNYFTYPGSLTTPPCSPIVTWIVLKKWATMSEAQFPGSTTSWATISALCRI
jgi:carbonic anhydrase